MSGQRHTTRSLSDDGGWSKAHTQNLKPNYLENKKNQVLERLDLGHHKITHNMVVAVKGE